MIAAGISSLDIGNIENSPYGEVETTGLTPFISGDAVYGFKPSNFREFLAGNGSVEYANGVFETTSGDTPGDYGAIRSFRSLNYKTGQGAEARFAALFANAEALTESGVGLVNLGDELSFGYKGVDFGVWHRYGGKAEIRTLQITAPASGGETATVTLNGTAYSPAITAGTVQKNAHEIATFLDTAGNGAFTAQQLDDSVIIMYTSDGSKDGTFSMSSSSATGTFTRVTQGITKTSAHVAMADWNGVMPTGFDPSKGNNYRISFQNGYGNIRFFIKDVNDKYVKCHTTQWANSNLVPNLTNPSLRGGMYCYSTGAVTPVVVKCAYIMGGVAGHITKTRNSRGSVNTRTSVGSSSFKNILALRCRETNNTLPNQVELEPLSLTLANDGTKSAEFEVRANPTVTGTRNYQPLGNNLVTDVDIDGDDVSGGTLLNAFGVSRLDSIVVDLSKYKDRIPPGLEIVVSGKMTSGSGDLTASLGIYEDI